MSQTVELMPAVILAGGLATRLRPLTQRIPKALIEVAGHPFLWHQLQLLKRSGIRRVVLLVGHLGESIQQRFQDGAELGISIDYCFDGPVLLGTAGAIRQALPLLPERFFVLYGDSYLPCNYAAVEAAFRHSGLPGLMTVYRNEGLYDSSNVEYDGSRILRYDKGNRTPAMHHIDYGLAPFTAVSSRRFLRGRRATLLPFTRTCSTPEIWRLSKCSSGFMRSARRKDCETPRSS